MVGAAIVSGKSTRNYDAKITSWVLLASLTAASGGFLFGYDIGITALLKELYTGDSYCKYDNQNLALFTSFLYAGGLLGTWGASRTTRAFRILVGSSLLLSVGLNTYYNLPMFIFGRFLLGVAVGLGNQAVPIYLSDIAPAEFRGLVNMFFQLFTSTGILIGSLVNYGFRTRSYMELILPGVPTAFMVLGVCLFGETPNGLIERGLLEKGKATLQKIRGTMNVEEEYEDLVKASDTAKAVKDSDMNILWLRSRPQQVMAFFVPAFQLLTAINFLSYAPILFQSLGLKANALLISSIYTGVCMVVSTRLLDKWGRRNLLTLGGAVMLAPQIIIAIILYLYQGQAMSSLMSWLVVFLIYVFVFGFGLSWKGLGWLVTFPVETRSVGQSITVAVNLVFTFMIAQAFLLMLCVSEFAIFFFFGGCQWVVILTIFVLHFFPEKMNVAIEDMADVWRQHWFWKANVPPKIFDVESGTEQVDG